MSLTISDWEEKIKQDPKSVVKKRYRDVISFYSFGGSLKQTKEEALKDYATALKYLDIADSCGYTFNPHIRKDIELRMQTTANPKKIVVQPRQPNPQEIAFGGVPIEAGVIAFGDPEMQELPPRYEKEQWLTWMQKGRLFCIGTGGDGHMGVKIRLKNEDEALEISSDDGEEFGPATEAFVITIKSGTIAAGDMWDLVDKSSDRLVSAPVKPGNYEGKVYLTDDEPYQFYGYILVMRPSQITEINNLVGSDF